MKIRRVSHISVIVRDQDEALRWYMGMLGCEKRADDTETIPGFRWLTVGFADQPDLHIALFKAGDDTAHRSGQGTVCVVETDDCRGMYQELSRRGVKFTYEPRDVPWGVSAVFEDLYGNPYNLVEPRG